MKYNPLQLSLGSLPKTHYRNALAKFLNSGHESGTWLKIAEH